MIIDPLEEIVETFNNDIKKIASPPEIPGDTTKITTGPDADVKPDVKGKAGAGILKFLAVASNALVAVEALYGAKVVNEIRQVEKDLDRKLTTAEDFISNASEET